MGESMNLSVDSQSCLGLSNQIVIIFYCFSCIAVIDRDSRVNLHAEFVFDVVRLKVSGSV